MPSKKKEAAPKKAAAKKTRTKVPPIDKAVEKHEAPYVLPRGCELEQVEGHIRLYQCFEFEDRVYCMRDKLAINVSNFTCHIEMHIRGEMPTRLITLRNEDKEEAILHVGHDVFNSLATFRKAVTADGNYQWKGTDHDYMRYLWLMMDRMGKGRMILEPGMQPEGFFAFSNRIIHGSDIITLDRFGCFDIGDSRYYVPAANTTIESETDYANVRRLRYVESPVTFEALSAQMRRVHGDYSMVATVHAIGAVFCDYIRERIEGYPVPFYYGPPGTGKDESIKGGQRFYFPVPPKPIRLPAANTSPGMVNVFAEQRNVPLYTTEWSSRLKDPMHEFCMGTYDGEGRRRGERIAAGKSRYATEDVPVRCVNSMSGNEYPNYLDQLLDRLLVMEMPKLVLSMDAREQFRILKDMETQGYSHLLADVVKHREAFLAEWFSTHYQRASEMVKRSLGDRFISERMRKTMCIMLSLHLFFADKLAWAFTSDELLAFLTTCMVRQQGRRVRGDEVSAFWSAFIAGVNARKLVRDHHYRLDVETGTIGFYWSEVFNVYMDQHRQVFGTPGKRDILDKLKQHECFVKPEGDKDVHLGYRIGSGATVRKSSAYVFDVNRTGTDLVGLIDHVEVGSDATF